MSAPLKHVIRKQDFVAQDYLDDTVDMDIKEIKQIREVFEILDINNNGLIDMEEMAVFLESQGFAQKNKVLFSLFKEIPNEKRFQIDWAEFLEMFKHRVSENNSRLQMKNLFDFLTINQSNELSVDALKIMVKQLGEDISEKELKDMVKKADLDGDGKVNFEDFYALMMQKTFT